MDGIAKACEQGQPGFTFCRIIIIDRDILEKPVDRFAQRGERGHCGFELFRLNRRGDLRPGGVERVYEGFFGCFGGVGEGFCTIVLRT